MNTYLIRTINQIESLIVNRELDQQDVLQITQRIFNKAGYFKKPFTYHLDSIYRAVANPKKEWFDSITKFGCPPTHLAGLNRCSWRRESAFYGSSDSAVPFFEIRAKQNDYIALSTWTNAANPSNERITEKIHFGGTALGAEQIISHQNCNKELRKVLLKDEVFKDSTSHRIKEIDQYVGQIFARRASSTSSDEHLYKVTSAIAKTFLQHVWRKSWQNDFIDGLIYPSVESELSGVNVMLTSRFAKRHLKLRGVALYQVEEYDELKRAYTLIPLESLQGPPHSPYWQKVHSKYKDKRFYFSPDTPSERFSEVNTLELSEETRPLKR